MTKKIIDIKNEFLNYPIQDIKVLIDTYKDDEREGVKRLLLSYIKKLEKYNREQERLLLMQSYENIYYSEGYTCIAGLDEVGRGPLAGPVLSCAVVLPKGINIQGINDSKKLSKDKREKLFLEIKKQAIDIGIGIVPHNIIDEINILKATRLSMKIALSKLKVKPDYLLIDALTLPDIKIPQCPIIKGDEKSITIAAASIIAKVTRDSIMEDYDKIYPNYGFDLNKGYGSSFHIEAIKKYGLSPIHRLSYTKNFI